MRSGTMGWWAPCRVGTPSMTSWSVPTPVDAGAHGDQAVGQIGDFRLAGGVGQDRPAVRQGGGHQQIFGGADRDERKQDVRALEALGDGGVDVAAFQADFGAHLLQPFQVQVDRPGADGAAAWKRDLGFAAAGEQGAEHQDGGAHFSHDVVGGEGVRYRAAERDGAAFLVGAFDGDAVLGEELAHGVQVGEQGDVGEGQALVGEQAGGHQREAGVFGAANVDAAVQRAATLDQYAVQT